MVDGVVEILISYFLLVVCVFSFFDSYFSLYRYRVFLKSFFYKFPPQELMYIARETIEDVLQGVVGEGWDAWRVVQRNT